MSITSSPAAGRRPLWPWVLLALGLLWTVALRVPLIVNAEDHLDSDLAVDGLTLLDAVRGHWRWHYPGTPYMSILPVLASLPQALAWGANPVTLVSGGTVIWVLVVAAVFWLAFVVYGRVAASWATVPLVFSSPGMIWLSGRITGGHLLALAWHAAAFAGLYVCLTRSGRSRWQYGLLGAWCGLGLYIDAMFAVTMAGLATAAGVAWIISGSRSRTVLLAAGAFLLGLIVGLAPREIGRRVDSYDAYPAQFAATLDAGAIRGHAELLAYECLPRLIAGSSGRASFAPAMGLRAAGKKGIGEWPVIVVVIGFAVALGRLGLDVVQRGAPARRAVAAGVLVSSAAIVAAFLVNRNIYNSDNYRYLVFLIVPWSLGFGASLESLLRLRGKGGIAAVLLAGSLAAGMTASSFRWYRDTRHYLDARGWPTRRETSRWDELIVLHGPPRPGGEPRSAGRGERFTIPNDVTHVFGGYWDVYRLSFLSEGRVIGIPYPMYPNRFRGWSCGLGRGRGKILILRPGDETVAASRPAAELPGIRPGRVRSARSIDWHPAVRTAWVADGRDPAELDQLDAVVP